MAVLRPAAADEAQPEYRWVKLPRNRRSGTVGRAHSAPSVGRHPSHPADNVKPE